MFSNTLTLVTLLERGYGLGRDPLANDGLDNFLNRV